MGITTLAALASSRLKRYGDDAPGRARINGKTYASWSACLGVLKVETRVEQVTIFAKAPATRRGHRLPQEPTVLDGATCGLWPSRGSSKQARRNVRTALMLLRQVLCCIWARSCSSTRRITHRCRKLRRQLAAVQWGRWSAIKVMHFLNADGVDAPLITDLACMYRT